MSCCSYCRVTGKSRILPHPHYPPLIPLPKPNLDEIRRKFCRVTGHKMESHHYLPILDVDNVKTPRSRNCRIMQKSHSMENHCYLPCFEDIPFHQAIGCRITKHEAPSGYNFLYPLLLKEEQNALNVDEMRLLQCSITHQHHFTPTYKYVRPVFENGQNEDALVNSLKDKLKIADVDFVRQNQIINGHKYVYPVLNDECGVILPAALECMLRSDNVDNVLVSTEGDKLLIETCHGESVEVDMRLMSSEQVHEEIISEKLMPGCGGGKNFLEEPVAPDGKKRPSLKMMRKHLTLDLADLPWRRSQSPSDRARSTSPSSPTSVTSPMIKVKIDVDEFVKSLCQKSLEDLALLSAQVVTGFVEKLEIKQKVKKVKKTKRGSGKKFVRSLSLCFENGNKNEENGIDVGQESTKNSKKKLTKSSPSENGPSKKFVDIEQNGVDIIEDNAKNPKGVGNDIAKDTVKTIGQDIAQNSKDISKNGTKTRKNKNSENGSNKKIANIEQNGLDIAKDIAKDNAKNTDKNLDEEVNQSIGKSSKEISKNGTKMINKDVGKDIAKKNKKDVVKEVGKDVNEDVGCDIGNELKSGPKRVSTDIVCNGHPEDSSKPPLPPNFIMHKLSDLMNASVEDVDNLVQEEVLETLSNLLSTSGKLQKNGGRSSLAQCLLQWAYSQQTWSPSSGKKGLFNVQEAQMHLSRFICRLVLAGIHFEENLTNEKTDECDKTAVVKMAKWLVDHVIVSDGELNLAEELLANVQHALLVDTNRKENRDTIARLELTPRETTKEEEKKLGNIVTKENTQDLSTKNEADRPVDQKMSENDVGSNLITQEDEGVIKKMADDKVDKLSSLKFNLINDDTKSMDELSTLKVNQVSDYEWKSTNLDNSLFEESDVDKVSRLAVECPEGHVVIPVLEASVLKEAKTLESVSWRGSMFPHVGTMPTAVTLSTFPIATQEDGVDFLPTSVKELADDIIIDTIFADDFTESLTKVEFQELPSRVDKQEFQAKIQTKVAVANSVVVGRLTTSAGTGLVTVQPVVSEGRQSWPLGHINTKDGPRLVVLGQLHTSEGPKVVALGHIDTDQGPKVVAIGQFLTPDGAKLIALGQLDCGDDDNGLQLLSVKHVQSEDGRNMVALQRIKSHDLGAVGSIISLNVEQMVTEDGTSLVNMARVRTSDGVTSVGIGQLMTKEGPKMAVLGKVDTPDGQKTVAMSQIMTSEGIKTIPLGKILTSKGHRMVALGRIKTQDGGTKLVALAPFQTEDGPKMMAIGRMETSDGIKLVAFLHVDGPDGNKMVALREVEPDELPSVVDYEANLTEICPVVKNSESEKNVDDVDEVVKSHKYRVLSQILGSESPQDSILAALNDPTRPAENLIVVGQFVDSDDGVRFALGRLSQDDELTVKFHLIQSPAALLSATMVIPIQVVDIGRGRKVILAKVNASGCVLQESMAIDEDEDMQEFFSSTTVESAEVSSSTRRVYKKKKVSSGSLSASSSRKSSTEEMKSGSCSPSIKKYKSLFIRKGSIPSGGLLSGTIGDIFVDYEDALLHPPIPVPEESLGLLALGVHQAIARGEVCLLENVVRLSGVSEFEFVRQLEKSCMNVDGYLSVINKNVIQEFDKSCRQCGMSDKNLVRQMAVGELEISEVDNVKQSKISDLNVGRQSGENGKNLVRQLEISDSNVVRQMGDLEQACAAQWTQMHFEGSGNGHKIAHVVVDNDGMRKVVVKYKVDEGKKDFCINGLRIIGVILPSFDAIINDVYDLYVAIADFNPSDDDMIALWEGQIVEVLDSHSSQKWLVRTRPTKTSSGKQGWVPPSYLEKKTMSSTLRSIQEILEMEADSKTDSVEREAHRKRNQVVKELIETEEEFSRDMTHVVKTYLRDLDNPRVPKEIRDLRDIIFMNFEKICDFHNNILMKGVQYYASEPAKLGRTFLRLERDFDMHVNYCRDIEQAQLVLSESPAKEYFAQYSQRIGEVDKTLQNHLKLPIQRINDYQLLLKELIKYSARLKEDCTDLQKSLDLMLSIPQRAQDLEYINSIEGYKGNLLKLGRLLRHDWFTVSDNQGHVKERYLFLFKSRILVTKVQRINEDRSIFILKDIIRLPDVEVKENAVDKCRFELIHKEGLLSYPLVLLAKTEFIREAWLKEIGEFADEIVDLGEDEIKVDSEETSTELPSVEITENFIQNHVTQDLKLKISNTAMDVPSADSPVSQEAVPPSTLSWLQDNLPIAPNDWLQLVSSGQQSPVRTPTPSKWLLEEPKEDSRPTTPGGTLVPHAPHFSMKLKDTEMIEGSSVRFMVKVRAHPEAEVKFFKDDKLLVFDDRVKLVTEDVETFELVIIHVTPEDAGKFSCHAKNAEGEETTEGNVTVTASRKVFIGLEDGATPEPAINGGDDVDFKWYRDGQEFEASERFKVMYKDEEDTLALVFQHVKPEDAGLYTCVASTASGNIACSAELTVQGGVNQLAREPQKPEITAELTDTEVSAGGSAMLELKVSGFPKPKVKWFRDGEEVVAGGRFRFLHEDEESIALVIKNVTKEDSGKYKVTAKNEIGEATTSAQLTVKLPPKFRSQMKDISIMMDELVRFEVEIEGKPTPDISWYKDGRPVVATGRIQTLHETEESFALIIKKVVQDDAGNYSCMASNSSGKISEFCELKVNAPPSFVKELKRIECKETETIKYEVKVSGSPMPKITWSANGEEIKFDGKHFKAEEDEKNFTLTVDSVTRKDAGKFTCTLTNEFGSVDSNADLIVNCTPEFEQRLKDVTIKEGDVDAKFDVKLSGTPAPKLRWFIDGMEIDETKKNFKTSDDGDSHSLIVKKVTPDVAGKLTVKATNSAGEVSCSGVVTVLAKPKFTEQLSDKEVTEGQSVTYTVKATGYPKPDIKWYKDNGEVTVDAKIKFTHDSVETWTMTLDCVAANVAGNYECRASNSEGDAKTSSKLIVNILVKTEETVETDLTLDLSKDKEKGYEEDSNESTVLIEPESVDKENENETNVELDEDKEETVVDDETPPTKDDRKFSDEGQWWLEEEEVVVTTITQKLKTDEEVDVVEDDVEIPQMTVEGNLRKLRQSELEGPDKAEIEGGVIIEEVTSPEIIQDGGAKPSFDSGLSDVDAWLGLQAILEVTTQGIPDVEVKWLKDGVPIVTSDRVKIETDGNVKRLVIKKTEQGDSGKYKVVIKNKIGEVSSEAKLQVKTPDDAKAPVFTHPLKDSSCIRGNPITFEVTVLGNPAPLIKWMKDGVEITESDKYHLEHKTGELLYKITIDECEVADAGKYCIFAENENGEASSEASLEIKIPPEVVPPSDCTVLPKGSTTCEAKATGNPQPKVKWTRNGKVLEEGKKFKSTSDEAKGIYTLIMTEVDIDDGGEYEVVAENEAGTKKASFKLNFTTAEPKFTKPLTSSTAVKPTTSVQLDVEVDGIPIPEVTWHFEGSELTSNEHVTLKQNNEKSHSLIIDKFEETDAGEFSCKAKSAVGEAVSKGKLLVKHEMPTFLKHLPKETCAIDGDSFALEAKIDGSPQPSIKWLKDGKEIVPSERVKIETLPDGTTRLKVDNAKPADCGKYSVVAKNETGEQVSTGAVSVEAVPKPPVIIGELKKTNVVEGKPLVLSVKVSGHPKPTIKWFKDGKPIKSDRAKLSEAPDGTATLTIDNAVPEDAGKYSVQVSNPLGESTSAADVTVQSPQQAPEFGVALKGCQAYEGFPIRLEGKVKGHPKPEIKWVKDGEPIVPDGERVVETTLPDGTFALVINNAKPEDAGKYACIATNPEGKAESSADVEVKTRAKPDEATCEPSFITPLRDVTVDEGTPLKLQAHIASNPLPDMTWSKDGQVLSPTDSRVQLSFDGDRVGLEIKKATPADAGKYECTLTNPHGTSASTADIGVKKLSKAPFFTQRFPDLETILGQDARFMCRVAGLPTPDISWNFNDKPIFDSDKYKLKHEGDMFALYVKNCTPEDIGNIHCSARNPEGEDKCSAFLNVSSKLDKKTKTEAPSFLKRLADCDVIEGMPGKFTACISGFPEPEFKWYKDGNELYPSDRIKIEVEPHGLLRLLIKDIKQSDIGKYTLKIKNDYGSAESEAHLRCEGFEIRKVKKPMLDLEIDYDKMKKTGIPFALPGKPIISKMTDRRLTLSWNPSIPIGPRVPVTYIVEMSEVIPDSEWLSIRTGIRGGCCEIKNLEPYQDYRFRIRVENKYGISDPSPYATAYRTKLEMTPPRILPRLPPEFDFRPETSPFFPRDYDIDRPTHELYAHAPRFMRQETDAQYGIRNQPSSIQWYVYGYPAPTISWYFNDEKIEVHGRYESSYSRQGQTTLFINRFLERDVGIYECIAINEHGEARQRVRMEISEPPVFSSHLDETTIMIRESGVLECRLVGVPYPEVKWYKDWHPIVSTDRIKIDWREPDLCTLSIKDAISKDGGLYSCAARNVAGMTSCSAMLTIEESESDYSILSYNRNRVIKARQNKHFEDFYDIGDELGRGTQGTIYHTVERSTGNSYAAKIMHGKGDYRSYMDRELDVMNQFHDRRLIRGIDAFDTRKGLTLVTELASGGLLLDSLCRQSTLNESEIAYYMRQVLWGLEHMHQKGYAHLGLTVGDILLARPGGDDIKITDFGLTRRLVKTETYFLDYGMPEFVAPEIANKQSVSFYTDMWSVGVITYIFLSGISPFLGEHDRQTLEQVQQGRINFDTDVFSHISDEAKDFMLKLLVFDQHGRMDVKTALRHPWLRWADRLGTGERYSTDRLSNYYRRYKDWVSRSGCRRFYRRRPLSSAFTHPSRMVYPPDEDYTPPSSPEIDLTPKGGSGFQWDRPTFSDKVDREHEDINYDLGYIDSESKYQNGPDTYLLQLRDVGLPLRLRQYMRVAGISSPSLGLRQLDTMLGKTVTIHERRRFTDIMDEEIDDEKKGIIDSVRKRITSEISPRSDTKSRLRELLPQKAEDGDIPFFREKVKDVAFVDEQDVELSCYAVGSPKPVVQWYRNDVILSETHRLKFIETPEGRSVLRFSPIKPFDAGVFKAIARNEVGDTSCRARLRLGDIPGRMEAPEITQVSSDQALLVWGPPKDTGNAAIIGYEIEYKEIDGADWISACKNIDHEFFVVHGLKPRTSYHFRCRAANKFGRGEFSVPSAGAVTNEDGGEQLTLSKAMVHQQQMSENRTSSLEDEDVSSGESRLDYSSEEDGIELSTDNPTEKYNFVSELSRGKFSVLMKCCRREENDQRLFAAKFVDASPDNEESAKREYDIMSRLRHESIACLQSAYLNNGKYVLLMDKLHGYDVLTYLASRHQYNEEIVTKIVSQLLDALQYLHFRNIAHLNIQPDNVVLKSLQLAQVKLVDFGSAQKIPRVGSVCLDTQPGDLDYRAPEVVNNGDVGFQADVWSVGVLTYVLLSGSVPYAGEDDAETKENILYVRYRFENLFKEITQESTRFLMQIFKKTPFKRLTVDECLEHKWLNPSEFMLKKRERAVFLSSRLQQYSDAYHEKRSQDLSRSANLVNSLGVNVERSISVEEAKTTYSCE